MCAYNQEYDDTGDRPPPLILSEGICQHQRDNAGSWEDGVGRKQWGTNNY